YRKQTVGDNRQRAASAIREALDRADLVLTSGGLGPTVDDITREAIADAVDRPLVRDPQLVERVARIFARWGRPPGANNLRQADLPEGATAIENPIGTAPGILVELPDGKAIIAVPGVPREMEKMIEEQVIPYLRARGTAAVIRVKVLRTAAIGESLVDDLIADLEMLDNPTVGLAAHTGRVDIRVTARAASAQEADLLIEHVARQIRRRTGEWIYGEDEQTLEGVVGNLLDERNESVAIYETLTGGFIARTLEESGASVAASETGAPGDLPDEETAKARASLFAAEHCAAWGLAIYSTEGDSAYSANPGDSLIVIAGKERATAKHYPQVGKDDTSRHWLLARALDLLRRELLESGE
ncbi:MAG: molybdopterin-binding protein, partial [Ardenticatenaceae bacterium]